MVNNTRLGSTIFIVRSTLCTWSYNVLLRLRWSLWNIMCFNVQSLKHSEYIFGTTLGIFNNDNNDNNDKFWKQCWERWKRIYTRTYCWDAENTDLHHTVGTPLYPKYAANLEYIMETRQTYRISETLLTFNYNVLLADYAAFSCEKSRWRNKQRTICTENITAALSEEGTDSYLTAGPLF